jgi:hypothetical protein
MQTLVRIVAAFLLLLMSCEQPQPATEQQITGACHRAFRSVLEAWESELGRVPQLCAYLDADYDVQLVAAGELPCEEPASEGAVLVGCTHEQVIYLLRGRDDIALIDTSVHEWLHALAECVDGTADRDHLRGRLWIDYGANTIEAQALGSVEIGKCL